MDVRVVFYGGLMREVGSRELKVVLQEEHVNVQNVVDELTRRHPELRTHLVTLVCAVDDNIVPRDHPLRSGDELALLPPVSGG